MLLTNRGSIMKLKTFMFMAGVVYGYVAVSIVTFIFYLIGLAF